MSVINQWRHVENKYISERIHGFLTTDSNSNLNLQIYYLDAINSFPIDELISLNLTSEQIGKINIVVALDLKDLLINLNKIIDSFNIKNLDSTTKTDIAKNDQNKTKSTEKSSVKNDNFDSKIYIIINGLETIFDNTLIQDATNVYSILNNILLKLRHMSCEKKDNWFNYLIIPKKAGDIEYSNKNKRRKLKDNLSFWEYIINYYL